MLAVDYVIVAYMAFPGQMAVIVLIFFLLFALVLVSGLIFPLLGFVWLVCGFALMGWYDITVIEKIFAPYRGQDS